MIGRDILWICFICSALQIFNFTLDNIVFGGVLKLTPRFVARFKIPKSIGRSDVFVLV